MKQPLVYTVILHDSRLNDTIACLESLIQSDYKSNKIILLDIYSTDSSASVLKQKYPEVQIHQLPANLGYAGNNNAGIKIALEQGADWVFILNNDTVLASSSLSSMIEAGECDPAVGIVGPMVYHFKDPETIQSAGGILGKNWETLHQGMNEYDRGQFGTVREVDWISGCAILARRGLIDQVGGFDPEYFLYWEEAEWCIRARRAGWKVLHVPQAKLWHKGVQQDYQPRPYVTYYMTRNYLFTLSKHRAPLKIRLTSLIIVFQTLLSWSLRPRWRHKREHRNAMWWGLIDFLNRRQGPMPSRSPVP
jgi:GT2 family glycosyltransferase